MAAKLFAILFPFERVGIVVGGYPVTLPFLCALLVSLASLGMCFRGRSVRRGPFVLACIFGSWCFATAFVGGVSTRQLAAIPLCLTLMAPLMAGSWVRDLGAGAVRWFVRGALLSVAVSAYQVGASVAGLPGLGDGAPFVLPARSEWIGKIPRLSGLFAEPSYYALYLAFVLSFVNGMSLPMYSERRLLVYRTLLMAALVATWSTTGVLLLALFYLLGRPGSREGVGRGDRRLRVGNIVAASSGLGIVLLLIAATESCGDGRDFLARRAGQVGEAVSGEVNLGTSVGIHISAPFVVREYLGTVGFARGMVGVGFGRQKEWLREHFWGSGFSALTEGRIPNTLAVLLIGTGWVGLALYLGWLWSLRPRNCAGNSLSRASWARYAMWIVAHGATGQLLTYPLMGYGYLTSWGSVGASAPVDRRRDLGATPSEGPRCSPP